MLDSIRIQCRGCGEVGHYSVPFIQGQIKAMKIEKRDQAAQQMHDKRGPFYDKWLAAMEKRGESKRCKTCLGFEPDDPIVFTNLCNYQGKRVNPGQYACYRYIQFLRD